MQKNGAGWKEEFQRLSSLSLTAVVMAAIAGIAIGLFFKAGIPVYFCFVVALAAVGYYTALGKKAGLIVERFATCVLPVFSAATSCILVHTAWSKLFSES